MALGLLGKTGGRTIQVRIAENVGAGGIAAPTLITDGFDLLSGSGAFKRFPFDDRGVLMVSRVTGSNLSVASIRAFGYYGEHVVGAGPASWGPMGPGPAATRGLMNLGGVIAQVGTTDIMLLDDLDGLHAIERIAFGMGAITGDAPIAVNLDLILKRRVG